MKLTRLFLSESSLVTRPVRVAVDSPCARADVLGVVPDDRVDARILLVLFGLLVVLGAVLVVRTVRRDLARGRFRRLTPPECIDASWLAEHVFAYPAEVVGRVFSGATTRPAVVALLTRMELERTLALDRLGARPVLRLCGPPMRFERIEHSLVEALFADDQATNMEMWRARGGPTSSLHTVISDPVDAKVQALFGAPERPTAWVRARRLGLIGGGALLLAVAAQHRDAWFAVFLFMSVAYLFAHWFATMYRRALPGWWAALAASLSFLVLFGGLALALLSVGRLDGLLASLATALLGAGLVVSLGDALRCRDAEKRVRARLDFASARCFFEHELTRAEPRLENDWIPYVLALDLTRELFCWLRIREAASTPEALDTMTHHRDDPFSDTESLRDWLELTFELARAEPPGHEGGGGG